MTATTESSGGHTIVGELDAIEQRYAALFGYNPDPVYAFDLEGRLLTGNRALELLTGFSLRELIGRSFISILVPDDRTRARRHFARAARGRAQTLEVSGVGRDGRDFTIAMTNIPMFIDGQVEGVYGIAKDVTRQRDAERALTESDDRYRLLADHVQDMISLHDEKGTFLYASPSAYMLLGRHPVELVGRSVYDSIEADDVAAVKAAHGAIMKHDGRSPVAFRARRADGSLGWFETTARMITRPGTDEPWRIIAVTRDISERLEFERHVIQSQKMEALGRLAGGVAHDFNNALTVISGHAELLAAALADRQMEREKAEHIREAALRATTLARQLLSFGRAERRDMGVTDLNAVILELQPMLTRLVGDDITLEYDPEPDLDSARCEPALIEQVLVNLSTNSREAMPDGGRIRVGTRNVAVTGADPRGLTAGPFVQLTVDDDGLGMSAGTAARAFDPFFTTKSETGSGLGLSTVYSIVRQTGGIVELESSPGRGTRVTVLIPGHRGPLDDGNARRAKKGESLRGSETIMVTEDDAGVRALVVATLQRYGYRVMTAVDGRQGLELFHTYGHLIDLIVTDVNMPELKGPDLIRILTAEGRTMPVLYISGFSANSLSLDDLAPRHAFLAKPFTPDDLARAVRSLLGPVTTV